MSDLHARLQETAALGRLVNRMRPCHACERWAFGTAALMRNLAGRGLLQARSGE